MAELTNRFSLKVRDFLKGFVIAVIVPALLAIQQALTSQGDINWKMLGTVALASFIGYLIKNYFTNDVPAARDIISEANEKAQLQR